MKTHPRITPAATAALRGPYRGAAFSKGFSAAIPFRARGVAAVVNRVARAPCRSGRNATQGRMAERIGLHHQHFRHQRELPGAGRLPGLVHGLPVLGGQHRHQARRAPRRRGGARCDARTERTMLRARWTRPARGLLPRGATRRSDGSLRGQAEGCGSGECCGLSSRTSRRVSEWFLTYWHRGFS